MNPIVIGLLLFFYICFGTCIACIEECDRYEKTGKYGVNPIYIFIWPLYILSCKIDEIVDMDK